MTLASRRKQNLFFAVPPPPFYRVADITGNPHQATTIFGNPSKSSQQKIDFLMYMRSSFSLADAAFLHQATKVQLPNVKMWFLFTKCTFFKILYTNASESRVKQSRESTFVIDIRKCALVHLLPHSDVTVGPINISTPKWMSRKNISRKMIWDQMILI